MMPRKRNHPHTRQEWEAIRPLFTKLYRDEDRNLSDIITILAQQGFHAKEFHYKRRIEVWGLVKNNRQSDMLFGAQTIKKRGSVGKDTVFDIRGQHRSRQEIQRYWKRRKLDPDRLSPIPSTPPGIRYRTPTPLPEGGDEKSSPLQLDPTLGDEDDYLPLRAGTCSMINTGINIVTASPQNIRRGLHFRHQTSCPRPLGSPKPFRTQEQALYYAREYYKEWQRHDLIIPDSESPRGKFFVETFFQTGLQLQATIELGSAPNTAQALQIDLCEMVPDLVEHGNAALVLQTLLMFVVHMCQAGPGTFTFLTSLLKRFTRTVGQCHPLAMLLEALQQSFASIVPIVESIFYVARDCLVEAVDAVESKKFITWYIHYDLHRICAASKNWDGALQHAKEAHRTCLPCAPGTSVCLFYQLKSQATLAVCYLNLGDHEESSRLAESGLDMCSMLPPQSAADLRSRFLWLLSGVKHRLGQRTTARDLLIKALSLRLDFYSAADSGAAYLARRLQVIEDEMSDIAFYSGPEDATNQQ